MELAILADFDVVLLALDSSQVIILYILDVDLVSIAVDFLESSLTQLSHRV